MAKKAEKQAQKGSTGSVTMTPAADGGPSWRDNTVLLAVLGGIALLGCCILMAVLIAGGVALAGGADFFAISPFEGEAATLEYPAGGIDLLYPAEWFADYSAGQVTLADSQATLEYYDWNMGAMMLIVTDSPQGMLAMFGGADSTTEGLMDSLTEVGWFEETSDRETRRFDSQEGLGVPINIPDEMNIQGYLATFSDGETAAVVISICPEDSWEANWPIFDAIMDSIVFYPPRASAERGDLDPGATHSATLDPGGADAWYYTSHGDEYVSVTVTAVDDWDPTLEAFNEDGASIGYNDDTNFLDPALMGLHLEEPGDYEFRVGAYSGYGQYEIRLMEADEPGGGDIDYGDTVYGSLDWSGEREEWRFEGREGDMVSISMVGQGALYDTYLELYGPDGSELTRDDDGGGNLSSLIYGFMLPEDGDYLIIARAFGSEIGPYELSLMEVQIAERSISYGETLEGDLTNQTPVEYWFFEGEAGDVVVISMVGQGSLSDTYLELYGPDGDELMRDDDSGIGLSALIDGYTLPEDGEYMIVARPYGGGSGPYELSLSLMTIETITYGRSEIGELTGVRPRQHWAFEGEAGDIITINVDGEQGLRDLYLELLTPGGMYLAQGGGDYSGSARIFAVMLPEDGEYHIIVSSWSEMEGSYDLLVGPADIQERQISYGETEESELTDEMPREYWAFRGRAGESVTISMEGLESFNDTYLELYGPDGALLTQNDDGGQGFFALIRDYELPETGDYLIVARGFGDSTGPYELTLTVEQ